MGLYRICTDANSTDCIESNTYDLSEIVTSVNSVCIRYLYKVKDANWTEDFAHSYTGRTYTLELPLKLRLRENFTNLLRIGLGSHFLQLYNSGPKVHLCHRQP